MKMGYVMMEVVYFIGGLGWGVESLVYGNVGNVFKCVFKFVVDGGNVVIVNDM